MQKGGDITRKMKSLTASFLFLARVCVRTPPNTKEGLVVTSVKRPQQLRGSGLVRHPGFRSWLVSAKMPITRNSPTPNWRPGWGAMFLWVWREGAGEGLSAFPIICRIAAEERMALSQRFRNRSAGG